MRAHPVAALLGELFGKNRTSLIATSIIAPAAWFAARAYFSTLSNALSSISLPVGFVLLGILGMQLAAIFAYVDLTVGSKSAGFPRHILLLPVPTWLLALVPIVAGSLFISVFALLWLRFVSGAQLAALQQLAIAAAIVAAMCWVQAMSWELLPPRPLRIVVLTVVIIGTLLSVICVLANEPDFLFGRTRGALGLAALILGGFGCAYLAVIRARRGDTLDLGAYVRRPLRILGLICGQTRLPALASGVAAQDWYEWRLYGRILPSFMLVVAAVPLASVAFGGLRKIPSIVFPSLMLLVFFAIAPLMGAVYVSKNLTRRVQMGSFNATRPLTDLDIAFAKLRLTVKSHLLSLAIVLGVLSIVIATSRNNAILGGLWSKLTLQLGITGACLVAGLALILAATASWAWTAYFMSLQYFGECIDRKKHGFKLSAVVMALFLGLLVAGGRLVQSRDALLAQLHSPHYQLWIPALVLLGLALCLLPRFRRANALSALRGLALGFGIGAGLCLLAVWQLHLSFGYRFALGSLVTTVAILAFVPFVLVPVLVDLNRHR